MEENEKVNDLLEKTIKIIRDIASQPINIPEQSYHTISFPFYKPCSDCDETGEINIQVGCMSVPESKQNTVVCGNCNGKKFIDSYL